MIRYRRELQDKEVYGAIRQRLHRLSAYQLCDLRLLGLALWNAKKFDRTSPAEQAGQNK